MTARTVPAEERLFSLVLALLATEKGLTKAQILSSVQGYHQRFDPAGDNGALERQFERDKDDLRELGIPLETIESEGDPGNNQLQRYRIPKGSYDLPSEISFTPHELALLRLAAAVWREGSLSAESRRALMKLRALGAESDEPLLGYAPRVQSRDAAFGPLSAAIEKGQLVSFPYLRPGRQEAREHVIEPLALFQFRGRWLFSGLTAEGRHPLTFLLSRIVGEVKPKRGSQFEAPAGDHAQDALAAVQAIWEANTATIEVVPGSDAATRLGKRYGSPTDGTRLTVHWSDLALLADELAGYGPEVFVVEPAPLREAVVSRLVATRDAHRGQAA